MKSSSRNLLLLSMAVIAVLFVTSKLFFRQDEPVPVKDIKETNQFVSGLSSKLSENTVTETDQRIVQLVTQKWGRNPFLPSDATLESIAVETIEQQKIDSFNLKYSGFLAFGEKKIAIINNLEYEKGDSLEGLGFMIQEITSQQVRLSIDDIQNFVLKLDESLVFPVQ